MGANPAPLGQPALGRAPEALDTVDVNTAPSSKHLVRVMGAMVLAIAHVDQPVVRSSAIRVDDAAAGHPHPANGVQGARCRVGDELGVASPIPFREAKDDRFAFGPASP
jgi:hypothetical protein